VIEIAIPHPFHRRHHLADDAGVGIWGLAFLSKQIESDGMYRRRTPVGFFELAKMQQARVSY